MTEKTIHTAALVVAGAAVLWALAHYFEERRSEREDRSPGATNIGPETVLNWPTQANDPRRLALKRAANLRVVAGLETYGNVP